MYNSMRYKALGEQELRILKSLCNLMTTLRNILTILTIGTTFQLFGQSVAKDTTFIFKDTVDGELQTIFIDNTKESKFYDRISHFNFQYFDNDSYKYSTDFFKEQKITLTIAKPIIPWTNWVTLKQYKGLSRPKIGLH